MPNFRVPTKVDYTPNFQYASSIVLDDEGLFSNEEGDSGGATQYGITQATLAEFRKVHNTFPVDVRELTVDMARFIYYIEYWQRPNIKILNNKFVAYEVFDAGVNCGQLNGVKFLQSACNFMRRPDWAFGGSIKTKLLVDGNLGPVTAGAVKRIIDAGWLIGLLHAQNGEQYMHYAALSEDDAQRFNKFTAGWANKRLKVTTSLMS